MPNIEVNSRPLVHVAVGVARDDCGRVLIALRGRHQHQGNLWEFPGGKVEPGEACAEALAREFKEEVGIDVLATQPLTKIEHHYADKSVMLDVHYITAFAGTALGREGQSVKWVAAEQLWDFPFPAANTPILHAVNLSRVMAITGDSAAFMQNLQSAAVKGAGLLQLRLKSLPCEQWLAPLAEVQRALPQLSVVVNSSIGKNYWADMPGLHLTSSDLMALCQRPVASDRLLGASCHNLQEVIKANTIGTDYIAISPVLETASHPGAEPLGWHAFGELVERAHCPVFALGGMAESDIARAQRFGGHGIAACGLFW